jgi:hypothetical protein
MFRRNTLLENGEKRIVVSTVGAYRLGSAIATIGAKRYYETMAFTAKKDKQYWDADVHKQLAFKSNGAICAETPEALPDDVDNIADQMHENVVAEFMKRLNRRSK